MNVASHLVAGLRLGLLLLVRWLCEGTHGLPLTQRTSAFVLSALRLTRHTKMNTAVGHSIARARSREQHVLGQ